MERFRDTYALSRWEESGDIVYIGWVGPGGRWVIEEYNTASGTVTYARGEEAFTNSWANRATLSYAEYYTEF